MTPLFNAVYHGCQSDRHQEACEAVYKDRILRGDEFFQTQKLGAFGTNLSLLSNFFDRPWTTPSENLSPSNRIWVTAIASFALRAVGRLSEALDPMQDAARNLEAAGDWANATQTYDNLSELQLNLGNIPEATDAAHRSIELADRSGDTFSRMARRARLGTALHQAGRIEEAAGLFEEAERIEGEKYPNAPFLTSLPGFQYCDLLLDQGKRDEVLKRARQAKLFSTRLLGIALDNLSVARACEPGSAESSAALDQAVGGLRQAGYLDYLLPCLRARAEHWRITGNFLKAQHDLDELRILATRFGMKLFQADYHLEQARLLLDEKKQPGAASHYNVAMELIRETGYHRRDGELLTVGARAGLCPTWLAGFEDVSGQGTA
jgi:tetratricopeptide (TPR) repeat protein